MTVPEAGGGVSEPWLPLRHDLVFLDGGGTSPAPACPTGGVSHAVPSGPVAGEVNPSHPPVAVAARGSAVESPGEVAEGGGGGGGISGDAAAKDEPDAVGEPSRVPATVAAGSGGGGGGADE